ncbi:E3 ubiquitin-protein ligase TRIM39 isoform X2 [Denticeps clupeoides]|uniref:E3 ubiquitin-protein ligase TRIM39 isoform X2 n=1 Tax=Denticeps clupeoides TaxID=299321 RepID=UPI0010A57449|nr:E3 ubiquitin-protein ligase TRIM39-like isoform X2 [Denticeps clupeoides]
MPFSRSFLSEEQFLCSICLDVFDNPVSTPCGHSFCMACIGCYWEGNKVCQCPLCKEIFQKKPELHINRTLREITEQFKRMTGSEGACGGFGRERERGRSGDHLVKPGEMPCELFTEMKRKFPKTCAMVDAPDAPVCVVGSLPSDISLTTANPSQASPVARPASMRRYTLSGPADSKRMPRCPRHHQRLELFCRTDQDCICLECAESEHLSHSMVPVEKQWQENKAHVETTESKIQQMIKERLTKMEEIRSSLSDIKVSAERETEGSMRIFSALVSSIERSQAELLEVIEMNRCSAEHQADGLIRQLEQEVQELRKRSTALGNLAQSNNYVNCLKTYPALCSPPTVRDWCDISVTSDLGTSKVYESVCQLLVHFQEEMKKLPEVVPPSAEAGTLIRSQPKVKRIQEYAVNVTLDPNTAHPRLILSPDRKQVRCSERHQPLPDTPERFDRVVCVLGHQGFTTGRHYWEVDVEGKTDWDVGVASHSINRKGKITVNPSNGYWFLSLRDKTNYAFRTEPSTNLPISLQPQKIGVFLDYEKGQVSFYNVHAKVHIYTFVDTFCDTIYPFFSPCTNKSGKNEAPLTITPVLLD